MKEQEEQWKRADDEVSKKLPPGVKLVRTLRGHTNWIGRIAWSPKGQLLASPSRDQTIRLWDAKTGKCLRILKGHVGAVWCVAFDPSGRILASGGADNIVKIWEVPSGRLIRTLVGHMGFVYSVDFDITGQQLISGSNDKAIKIWGVQSGQLLRTISGHQGSVYSVSFDPSGRFAASGGQDSTVKLWDVSTGRLLHNLSCDKKSVYSVSFAPSGQQIICSGEGGVINLWDCLTGRKILSFEGHTASCVNCVTFSKCGKLIASKSSNDATVRLWDIQSGAVVGIVNLFEGHMWPPGVAFHSQYSILATVGSDPGSTREDSECQIYIFELNFDNLLGQIDNSSVRYVNAKVVLVGDTGVGKSGLSLVLNRQPFQATDSTPGRRVWSMGTKEERSTELVSQSRETLLWDLAGQPGYRVIHQLHLSEVVVALVVFDSRSETDPLAGVRHWERALRLAQQRQGAGGVPMKKFLVSARNDRGVVSVSKDRLQALIVEYKFDGYFETSAKEGWKIDELRTAIEQAIPWEVLPEVSSSQLFAEIKAFLIKVKETGRLLALPEQFYADFVAHQSIDSKQVSDLRAQFETCIGRLEARDLIRRLSFGGYVLLQPELLDAYASAMVNTAKEEPDGLGSLAEEIALVGKFFVPPEHKVKDAGQEQLLLHATVEELVRHDLALRENADDGRYLVFPSQFNRDYEDAPEPKGKAVAITFDGPVQSLYATLAVRLGHSGLFTTGRAEMWRNAAVFTAKAGGKCGLFVNEFSEGRGRLILFYDERTSQETRYHFEEYVLAHAARRSLEDSVNMVRFFVCHKCGEPVPDAYVKTLLAKGKKTFNCPCGGVVLLAEPKERLQFKSEVEAMDKTADRQRDFDSFVMSAKGETSTPSFIEWAGGERVTLAIVFTDVVGSTKLGNEIGDSEMNEVRRDHFEQSRELIRQHQGREIKTIGDSFMAGFKCVGRALDYAMALQRRTGHARVQVRAGIHIGPMHVDENDVFGGTVNYASRVVGAISGAEIWLSDRAKADLVVLAAKQHIALKWDRHDGVEMKGFSEKATLWSLKK